jgi:hypothetical protein
MNKAYGFAGPNAWYQDQPSSCTQASFDEVLSATGSGSPARRVGISFQINVMDPNTGAWMAFLNTFLSLAAANNVAVAITLDAFEFWDQRPDL